MNKHLVIPDLHGKPGIKQVVGHSKVLQPVTYYREPQTQDPKECVDDRLMFCDCRDTLPGAKIIVNA